MRFSPWQKVSAGIVLVLFIGLAAHAAIGHRQPVPVVDAAPVAPLNARLKIPSIGIDIPIDSAGRTSSGAMEAPAGPQGVVWYSFGTRPGEEGSAVLAGHSGWKDGIPATFDNLNRLQTGDKVFIVDASGKTLTFVVRSTRIYGKEEAPQEVFTSSSGAHLNLITCAGDWNPALKSTTERLVVFTDLVS